MSLEKKKPLEPVIVLIGALILFIVGLNYDFVSLRFNFLGQSFKIVHYTGYQIQEAWISYSISSVFVISAIFIYYFGNSKNSRVYARNLLIGVIPGLIGSLLIYTNHSQAKELAVNYILALSTEFTKNDANQLANMMTPDLGFGIAFIGLVLMGISAYMMGVSKFSYAGLTKEAALYPDLKNFELTDEITMDSLKALWYCPNDNTKLMGIANRTIPNPNFRVSEDRLDANIDNAVAMRKISSDLVPYAKSLASVLLKKSKHPEIELVSTQCSVCRQHFISPQLSDWYNQ